MFTSGCGRLFEGSAVQMLTSLNSLAALPDATLVYCGHEYTLANARFAAHVEPDSAAVSLRLVKVAQMREKGEATLPTTIGEEKATNPFMRARSAGELGRLRTMKDSFG